MAFAPVHLRQKQHASSNVGLLGQAKLLASAAEQSMVELENVTRFVSITFESLCVQEHAPAADWMTHARRKTESAKEGSIVRR